MVGSGGSGISEHAFGNAIDIAAFMFSDGRRLTVEAGWHGTPEEQGFLRDVHLAACDHFRRCWRRATTLRTTTISTSI